MARRHRLLTAAVIAALALMALARPAPGYACSCAPVAPLDARDHADAVLSGRVTAVAEPWPLPRLGPEFPLVWLAPDPDAPIVLTVAVDRVWKGPEKAVARVLSDNPATSQCGVYVTPGMNYVIYAMRDGETLHREICQRFVERPQAGDDLAQLGPGVVLAAQPDAPWPQTPVWLLALGLVTLTLGALWRRRLVGRRQ